MGDMVDMGVKGGMPKAAMMTVPCHMTSACTTSISPLDQVHKCEECRRSRTASYGRTCHQLQCRLWQDGNTQSVQKQFRNYIHTQCLL